MARLSDSGAGATTPPQHVGGVLRHISGPRAVDALAAILRRTHGGPRGKDAQLLRSSARFALESIGGEAAQEALRGDAPPRRSLFGRLFGGG